MHHATARIAGLAVAVAVVGGLGGCSHTPGAPGASGAPDAAPPASGAPAVAAASPAPRASASPMPDPTPEPGPVSIDWVGDMTFGTPSATPPGGARTLLASVPAAALAGDVTLGNLETALGDGLPLTKCAPGQPNCYEFETPAATARVLADAGFDAVNVANNHTIDAGTAGELSTDQALGAAGVSVAGRPGQITYLERGTTTVALLGFSPYSFTDDALDVAAATTQVKEAKTHADLVIVMTHLGAEGDEQTHVRPGHEYFLREDRGDPIALAHAVIDAGADLVVGSGPHVLRGMEWYRGHLIAYSLGNFCGYHTLPVTPVTALSAVLHVTLDAHGDFVSGGITPLRIIAPGTPTPDPGGPAIELMNSLARADFGATAATLDTTGAISPPK